MLCLAAASGCDGGETTDGSGGGSTVSLTSGSGPGGTGAGSPTAQGTGQTGGQTGTGQGAGQPAQTGTGGSSGCAVDEDCFTPTTDCRRPHCDAGTCSEIFEADGTLVADETPGDCRATACDGAGNTTPVADDGDVPDDDKECTVDACDGGLPTSTPKAPGELCSENDGRFCSAAGTCQWCPPIDEVCTDAGPGEPNDEQGAAHSFGEIIDDDDEGMRVCGVLGPGDDADWYTYTGTDELFAEVGPGRTLNPQDDQPPGSLRICKFVACLEGPTTFACPGGTTAEVAPGGQQGCCASSLVDISDDFLDDLCSATGDDDAQVWIRVDRVGDAQCVPYDLDFHY